MAGISPVISDYSWLFNSTINNKRQDSISKLWSAYGNYQTNANNALVGLSEINGNLKSLLASYEEAKTTFNAELNENMSDLSDSATALKNYNFKVEAEGAVTKTTETDKDGKISTTTTYSKDLQAALDTVKNFVSDYNSSIKFFQDNGEVSKRVERMATVFGDTTYRASLYESVGVTVGANGSLGINEDKLVDKILNDPEKVSSILGKGGFASKAEDHISFAKSQQDKLFPAADVMLGDQISMASIYTGKAYRNMSAYSNMGNLLNMMF